MFEVFNPFDGIPLRKFRFCWLARTYCAVHNLLRRFGVSPVFLDYEREGEEYLD